MDDLRIRFDRLIQQNLPYVILMGWKHLPHQLGTDPILMLFEARKPLQSGREAVTSFDHGTYLGREQPYVKALELETVGDPKQLTFWLYAAKERQPLTLIPKGAGFLPEKYETRLLSARMRYNDTVSIPTVETLAPALLYHRLHRTPWLLQPEEKEFRDTLIRYLDDRLGPYQQCQLPQYQQSFSSGNPPKS